MRIALYQPDIPQNTGNIFRLASCFGINVDIIGPTGFIFDDSRFKRSMMDYMINLQYKRHLDWNAYKNWSKEKKYRLILLTTKSIKPYTNFKFKKNDIILFGQESSGVPKKIHEMVDERLTIPMKKGLRSLNISSAVAIVASEASRQLNLFR
tara:strand:- start:663 stop:1118 length:456 start_codon:yes stop_codon:yes gene_type:complete